MLANQLGFLYIDTGAMYRTVTYMALQKGVSLDDEDALQRLTASLSIELRRQPDGTQKVYCNGSDVSEEIRTPLISQNVSKVAMYPRVREELVRLQRQMAESKDVVMDGRDAGTVILPEAQCKIFLVASLEERARRRMVELQQKGFRQDFEAIKDEMAKRDYLDEHRASSPLKPAPDAVIVDTTALSPEETLAAIIEVYQEKVKEINNKNE